MSPNLEIPSEFELMLSVMKAVEELGGSAPAWKIESAAVRNIDPRGELMQSQAMSKGTPALLANTSQARVDCTKAQLLENPEGNIFQITDRGSQVVALPRAEARIVIEKILRGTYHSPEQNIPPERGDEAQDSAAGQTKKPRKKKASQATSHTRTSKTTSDDKTFRSKKDSKSKMKATDSPSRRRASDNKKPSAVQSVRGKQPNRQGRPPGMANAQKGQSEIAKKAAIATKAWEKAWKQKLLERLRGLPQPGLKRYVLEVLRAFQLELHYVGDNDESGTEDIDGIGVIPISPLISTTIAVQVNQQDDEEEPIGRDAVVLFQRSAYAQGADRGVMVTLGTYTEGALEASRDKMLSMELIDGEKLCDMIREKEVGVRLTPQPIPAVFKHFGQQQ